MHIARKTHLQFKVIGWLLIAAVLVLTVQPMHIHLQHIDNVSAQVHEHAIDLHFSIDNIVSADHKDAAVFPVTPDVMLKKLGDNPLLAAILVCLLILLLTAATLVGQRPVIRFLRPASGRYSIAPPLRAPPLS